MKLNRRGLMVGAAGGSIAFGRAGSAPRESARTYFGFEQWDVFTAQPLTGNPLAVFVDARGLSDARMQAIAREMNLSETSFVFPRDTAVERERGVHVRIFTPTQELPFAGHPVLGTAMAIREARGGDRVELDLKAGKVPVVFRVENGMTMGTMSQPEPAFLEEHRAKDVAPLFGLQVIDIGDDAPIQSVSTGRPKVIVPLRSLDALRRVQVDFAATARYFSGGDSQRAFYFVTQETVDTKARFHARYPIRMGEDPVTGSAGGCAIAWAVKHGLVRSGETIVIEQGHETGRPGAMTASAELTGVLVTNVQIGGACVKTVDGRLLL